MLELTDLHAGYGQGQVLQGVNLSVAPGELVCLVGRNGSGRSTTLKVTMGLVPLSKGRVTLNDAVCSGKAPYEIARQGIGYVPEERLVFPNLTVEENLRLGEKAGRSDSPKWTFADVYELFPRLRERRNIQAGYLSGGEQQMLTICRSLMGNPSVMLIDEPTEGLSPQMVRAILELIRAVNERGISVLLVEQRMAMGMMIASRILVMGHGKIVFDGTSNDLGNENGVVKKWLEVG